MDHGIFHQIIEDLLHEHRVHRDLQPRLGQLHLHFNVRKMLLEFFHDLPDDLLRSLHAFLEMTGAPPHPGNGQQVLHHPDQPLPFPAHIVQQGMLLLRRKVVGWIQHRLRGANDGRQRGTQIMSHGPQKICPQPLPLRLDPDLLLLLDMSGQGTGHDRDQKKCGKGQEIARPLEFKLIVGR